MSTNNTKIIDRDIDILLKQREVLVTGIVHMYSNLTKIFVGFLSICLSLFAFISQNKIVISDLAKFMIAQAFIFIITYLFSVLMAANTDRDYIRAIDAFLKEEYNINVLFYQGEASKKHITSFSSRFSILMLLLGFIGLATLVIGIIDTNLLSILTTKWYYITILGCEAFVLVCLTIGNMADKARKNTVMFNDLMSQFKGEVPTDS